MKNIRSVENTIKILGAAICLVLFLGTTNAQEVEVTSGSPSGSAANAPADPASTSDYEVKSSIEFGVRGRKVNGSLDKYRSDLNYGPGFRVFDSSLLITAKEGTNKPFDTFLVTGSGWNADPNGYARINIEKLGWYRFDSTVRRMSYFNNLDNFALGEHTRNTKRNMGDFDVTFLPQNENIRFNVGYSFNRQSGPGTITYDYSRDEYEVNSRADSISDDFRFGVEAKVLGFHLTFTEGFRTFRDDTQYSIDGLNLGANPSPNSSLSTFTRRLPERGKIYDHRFAFSRSFGKRVDLSGRLIYSDSRSRFSMIEELTGKDNSGNTVVLDRTDVNGDAKRPNFNGDIGVTFLVTDKLRISNSFSANSYRISGGHVLFEALMRRNAANVPLADSLTRTFIYRFTNFRRYMNTIEGDYDFNRYFSFYLGYRYSNRKVDLNGLDINLTTQSPSSSLEDAKNTANTFLAGFKATPIPRKWTIFFDLEHGQADNAFTRLANYDVTNFRVRSTVKPTNRLSLNFSFQHKDNNNPSRTDTIPPENFAADVKSYIVAGSFDWNPSSKASLSGGYTYNRLTSTTDVIFPSTPPGGIGQGLSRYFLRNSFFNLDGWIHPHKRISFFASYRISHDNSRGDFYDAPTRLIESSYPLSFQSPEARLIIRLTKNIDWNVGYQYYNYDERVRASQNYSAHLPYTSLRIYWGAGKGDR